MSRIARWCLLWLAALVVALPAVAHDLPISYLDLRVGETGTKVTLESSAKNFAREAIGADEGALLLRPDAWQDRLFAWVASRLDLDADWQALRPELRGLEVLPARKDVRIQLFYPFRRAPEKVTVRSGLFSADPRHKTFVKLYRGEALKYQNIFHQGTRARDYLLGSRQTTMAVIRKFVREGVHHFLIGPDHILFVIGLLLLGGTIPQLLKIVTAFTLAHSVTLVLATLDILNPPLQFIEPAIALSIIFVGAHALLQRAGERDWRLVFAFGFGFIHGFGFANVLRDMQLPSHALGWSLFSFNAGVEILAGAFWFTQRLFS